MVRVLEHVKVHVEAAHVKVVTLVGKYKRKFYFCLNSCHKSFYFKYVIRKH